jgi:hypothetical protein
VDGISVEAVFNKLGGVEGARRFLCGELILTTPTPAVFLWRPWMTIMIGGVSKKELVARVKRESCELNDRAESRMLSGAYTTSAMPRQITIVRVMLRNLGFTENPTTRDILNAERLACYGLGLLPPEAAPFICFAHPNQPKGECLWVGTGPISDSDHSLYIFAVSRKEADGRWMGVHVVLPLDRWDLEHEWVFGVLNK